jgi:catechol 2,3-dioxygenase-like lactoylglutathione lyase family enzyme
MPAQEKERTMTTTQATTFHHVGLITHDMDTTIARYEQLGFFFTPLSLPRISLAPGRPPEPFGAGNRTAIFEENYLEVLARTDLARWNTTTPEQRGPYDLDVPLARYEGMHVMHFGTDDLAGLHDRLTAEGVECTGIKPFERNVDTPDGQQMMKALAFSFPPRANPEGLVQVAQHLTPELVLQPRFMQHPNGARLVTESIVCAADPQEYARKYSCYTGYPARQADGHVEVDFGARCRVTVVTPGQVSDIVPGGAAPAEPALVGFTVLVADLDRAAGVLTRNGVPFQAVGPRLVVAPADACGAAVRFEA